ncbi:MAG: hypothetical protein R3E10_19640 [Gemmatimonadota bacterium]
MFRSRTGRQAARLLLALSALTPAACVTTASSPYHATAAGSPTRVRVTNQLFEDVTVYLRTEGGPEIRLGVVPGLTSRTLPARAAWLGARSTVLSARTLGARVTHVSQPVLLVSGFALDWVVEPSPSLSAASIRVVP